jgi:RNA polymerase sigma-70 factor (ECF subfamily)
MVAYADSEDGEGVRRCKRGEVDALRRLFEKYQARNYSVAYGIVRNREDALEVSQEAFIKVYRSLKKFRGKSSFSTWLFRITTNQAIDFLRRSRKHRTVEEPDWDRTPHPPGEDHKSVEHVQDPSEALAAKQLGVELERAMGKLSAKQRAVLVLREIEGFSYEEISRTLGCPKGTVMSRLHSARSKLRELMEGYDER